MDINFYNVDLKYIEFLKKYETEHRGFTRVPNVSYHSGNNKFFYGTVLEVNDINYFVPVSSKEHLKQDDLLIRAKNRSNLIYGTLRFAYMLPIPKECLSLLIRDKLNDSQKSLKVKNELAFCRRNKDKIKKQAELTYERIVTNVNKSLSHNSCDFKLLEQAYIEYCIKHKLECSQVSNKDNAIQKLNEIYANVLEDIKTDNVSLPTSIENKEDRVAVSEYINEQLNGGNITESQKASLENLRQEIRDFEEPLFNQTVEEMAQWADDVIQRFNGRNEQDRDDSER